MECGLVEGTEMECGLVRGTGMECGLVRGTGMECGPALESLPLDSMRVQQHGAV